MRRTILTGLLACCVSVVFGQAPPAKAEFEVASIKPNTAASRGGEGSRRENITAEPGSLIMLNVSLRSAIEWAYNVKDYQVSGPGWLADQRFDISAKAASAADEPRLRAMLQTLLADRFKLAVHRETKVMSVYALTVDKSGVKFSPGNPAGQSRIQPSAESNRLQLVAVDTTMEEFADLLSMAGIRAVNLDAPVVDQTGLKGRYNLTIDGTDLMQTLQATVGAGKPPDADTLIGSVEELLRSQLGLKTEMRKMPGTLIVVDRAEKVPTQN